MTKHLKLKKGLAIYSSILLFTSYGHAQTATEKPVPQEKIPVEKVDKEKNADTTAAAAREKVAADMAPPDGDELVVLSPFEISTSQDKGYQANDTMAGTRLRTDLKDVASSISVYTKEFMADIGATDSGTLLQYTTNAEVAGTRGTYAGLGNGSGLDDTASLRAPGGAQRIRGLAAADTTRDLFITDIPWDSYNSDRTEIQRGPNAILFGLGSPAGIINSNLRSAEFRNLGSAGFRFGSYGSARANLDANVQLIPKVLAIRIDAMKSNEKYQQEPAFQDTKRMFGAIRFEPKLFGNSSLKTIIKANFEKGDIDANRPRIVPPTDRISPWFNEQDRTSMQGGMIQSGTTKYSVDNPYNIGAAPETVSPWLTAPINQQQPAWYMDGVTGQLYQANGGFIHTGSRNSSGIVTNSGLPNMRYASQFYGVNGLYGYANNARLPGHQYGQYKDQAMLDPTVFDFYNNLIDGPTKSEFEDWQAYNFDFSQTAFNDRLGFNFAFDKQNYNRGGQSMLGWNPSISVDVTRMFLDGSANPNFGRPYIMGNSGDGSSYESDRTYGRAQLYGELRATDFIEKGFLTKLLGRHRLHGIFSSETYKTDNRSWTLVANSQDWQGLWTQSNGSGVKFTDRGPLSVIYLGPSLENSAKPSGISRIQAPVTYPNGNVYIFDSRWQAATTPASVFSDPWTVPTTGWQSLAFASTAVPPPTFTQASNPANYTGWSNYQMQLQRYNNGADESLTTRASLLKKTVKSYAGTWQAFMWNDAIVPTLGWRYDRVTTASVVTAFNNTIAQKANFSTTGSRAYVLPTGPVPVDATGKVLLDYSNQGYKIDNGHSTSGGVVVHLNKLFKRDWLPLNISLSYNKSQNFQVTDARRDMLGNSIANPEGKTKEFGLLLSTKDRKYSFRAVKYDTRIYRDTVKGFDFGALYNMPQQGVRFRNVFLYKLAPAYLWIHRETDHDRNRWQTAYVDSVTGRPLARGDANAATLATVQQTLPTGHTLVQQDAAAAAAMRDESIRAWNSIQSDLTSKGFYAAWGYTPVSLSALTDRATYEATLGPDLDSAGKPIQHNAQFVIDPESIQAYASTAPQGLAVTSDTQSKGYEFELTANPTKNWRVQFSASQTVAVRTNVGGKVVEDMVAYFDALMEGPAGDMRQYSGGYGAGNEVRAVWNNWRGKYTLLKLQEGAAVPEIRKWRYNVTSNYSFDRGWLKGVGIGANYRWQDKVVIGYPTLPVTYTKATYDLSKPYYGPAEDAFDAWLSYERKISAKLRWKIQLNVRNLFYKNGKIPITVEPDGYTWAGVRIKPTQEWFLTNTLMF